MDVGTESVSTKQATLRSGGLQAWNRKLPSQSDDESVQGGPNASIDTAAGES